MLLAVDLGGTNTRMAVFAPPAPSASLSDWTVRCFEQVSSQAFRVQNLSTFLKANRSSFSTIQGAGFSLAGPIQEDCCQLTNLGYTLQFSEIRSELAPIQSFSFVNDLVATAHSLPILPVDNFVPLSPCAKEVQPELWPKAVLAPGTGLGQSALLSDEYALATEGAHSDFAPTNAEQIRLLQHLLSQQDHVSYEHVLSGSGFSRLYSFFAYEDGYTGATPLPVEITQRALSGQVADDASRCWRTLALYISILGAQAGNLALQTLPHGGLYLGGGIVPHILPALLEGRFLEAFYAKGRFRRLLEDIPVFVVTNERAALWGAARLALLALHK